MKNKIKYGVPNKVTSKCTLYMCLCVTVSKNYYLYILLVDSNVPLHIFPLLNHC